MTTLTFDIKKIEKLISNGNHERAAQEIFEIIEKSTNKELIYKSLNLLNLICDKTPSISLKTIKNIEKFITDSNSWIRLVSLEILYQISMFRPNLLIDLIDKIRARLFDHDPSVRRMSIKIMGTLILSLHIDLDELQDLIEEFTGKLMDNDWKVKFQVIKIIKKLLNQDYTKIRDLEPLLSMVIVNLRDEDDDVARAAADLLKLLGNYFLSKEKIFYILLNLLYNEKPRVKELIIWLFGEIGKEKSSEIIPIIPKLINLLKEHDYRIHLKVIDALVSIAENNFDQIFCNLIDSLDTSNHEYRNNLINAFYALSQKNISIIFPYLFEEIESPSENIREGTALVFKRLFEEYHIEIENEITKILYHLESKYWRERKNTIILLQNICFILKNQELAVWISIELNRALQNEVDSDIKEEIRFTINKIKSTFKDIDKKIQKTKNQLNLLNKEINEFQKIPAEFRKKLNSYIKDYKFNDTEIRLDKEYNKILKKINKFHNKINNFEYKRLAFDLIEEWEETKFQIIDELSIIKGFISKIYEDKKLEFMSNLKVKIQVLVDRINVLKAQFEYIKDYNFNDNLEILMRDFSREDETLEEKFANITQIRKNLFKLDLDIRELLIHNVEFNDIFKELITKWVKVKIEIQEYLINLDNQIKLLKEQIAITYPQIEDSTKVSKTLDGLTNELAFQLLQGHIQSVIAQGIEVFKKFNDKFEKYNSKLELFIKKKEFDNVKKLIDMKSTQIQTFISETEHQIDNLIGKEKISEDNRNVFNLFIRPYIDKWNASKELLINKLKHFNKKYEEKLYLNQFKHYLKLMNPIKLDLLSSYIGLEKEQLKDLTLKFINKNKLNVKILNNYLYSQKIESIITDDKNLLFFKNVKTIGNKIYLYFKLNNPSNLDFKDLQISLKIPTYLKFLKKESFPKHLHISELKTGNVFKFNYVLKIDKNINRNLADPSADEISINLYYKGPFDIPKKTTKKINLLLP
ncbi:MAG: hypothetical protein ACFFDO_08170 [Candidatus Thorarchaeota archaeon]